MSEPVQTLRAKRQGWLLISTIFLLGIVCGAALFVLGMRVIGVRPVRPPDRPPPGFDVPRMAETLDLDEDQRKRIERILSESRDQVHAIIVGTRDEVSAVLTEEQRARMDELRPKFGRRGLGGGGRHRRRGHRPPPPPSEAPFEAPPEPPPPPENGS